MGDVIYLTIVSSIKEDIQKGKLAPGDCLESEAALMERFSASRMTIRKSLSLLSNEGFIYSVPGKGNFVCKPQTDLFRFKFNKYDGLNINVDDFKLLSVQLIRPTERVAQIFGENEEQKVMECVRVLYGPSQRPLALERIFLLYEARSPVLEDVLKYADYMKPVEEKLAFSLDKTLEINTVPADKELRQALALGEGAYVNQIEEILRDEMSGRVLQFVIFSVNPKYFTIKARRLMDKATSKIY